MVAELRPIVPDHFHVTVRLAEEPDLHAWKGAAEWATTREFQTRVVTKAEWAEGGADYCHAKFSKW